MWGAALLALGVTLLLAPLVLAGLHRLHLLDLPSHRSSHERPTPRGGGVAPAVGALAGLAASDVVAGPAETGLVVAAVAFGVLGLAEDVRGVPPLPRLGLQLVVGAAALPWLLHGLHGHPVWVLAFTFGALVWLVAYVNAFNFMDGINGISAAQCVVAGVAWYGVGRVEEVAPLAVGGLVVAGAAAGFAPFNAPRARMFLGDVGSYFLGGWLAALVVVGLRAGIPPEAVVAPLAPYLTDTAATIVRRVARGERWYLAHCDHAYQRLVRLGWSHTRTTLVVGAVMAACAALGAVSLTAGLPVRLAADAALAGVLAAYLAAPARLARRRSAAAAGAS